MAPQAEKVILEASVRSSKGKGPVAELRRQDLVPAVVYGEGKPSVHIQVATRDLSRALHTKAGENVLITLQLKPKSEEKAVLIKELQHHPVTHRIIHVDFHQVSLTKRITVSVPLAFKGEPVGVKQSGGILEHIRWDLEVECLPTQIPAEIPVDVSALDLGQTLAAKAVPMPEGVKLVTDPELPVASCVMPKVEEAAPTPEEAAAAATEPEVLKQKKPEEIAAEAAEAEAKEKSKEKEEKKKG